MKIVVAKCDGHVPCGWFGLGSELCGEGLLCPKCKCDTMSRLVECADRSPGPGIPISAEDIEALIPSLSEFELTQLERDL